MSRLLSEHSFTLSDILSTHFLTITMFSKLFLCLALSGLGAGVAVPSSQIVERGADFVSEQLVGVSHSSKTLF